MQKIETIKMTVIDIASHKETRKAISSLPFDEMARWAGNISAHSAETVAVDVILKHTYRKTWQTHHCHNVAIDMRDQFLKKSGILLASRYQKDLILNAMVLIVDEQIEILHFRDSEERTRRKTAYAVTLLEK